MPFTPYIPKNQSTPTGFTPYGSVPTVADTVANHQAQSSLSNQIFGTSDADMNNIGNDVTGGIKNFTNAVDSATDIIPQGVSQVQKGFQEMEPNFSTNESIGSKAATIGRGALDVAGGAINTLFAPITAAVGLGAKAPGVSQTLDTVKKYVTNPASNAISDSPKLQQFMTKYPHADEVAANLIAIGGALVGGAKAPEIQTAIGNAGDAANSVVNDIGPGVQKAGENIKTSVDTVTKAVKSAKESVLPSLTPEEQVGKIIQGKTSDIPSAQRTFNALPSDVNPAKMAPSDLSGAIAKKIQSNLDEVDQHYANDNTPHPMSYFEQTTGKGTSAVKTNYVQQAIDQLKDFYTKTNDAEGLSAMKALEEKANTEGLTSKELNELAKEHGSTIQAFNANGEAASGLSKQAAENTRAGVKTTARNVLSETNPDAAMEVTRIDRETSDAIKTKKLIDNQVENAARGVQKNGKGVIGRAINKAKKNPTSTALTIVGLDKVIKGATGIGL